MKRKTIGIMLFVTPIASTITLFLLITMIYSTFQPPAIFDELTATSSQTERWAYNTNAVLYNCFAIIIFFAGPLSILASLIIAISSKINRKSYAKN